MSARLCSYDTDLSVFTPEECDRVRALGAALDLRAGRTDEDTKGTQLTVMRRNCTLRFVQCGDEAWDWVFARINERAHGLNSKRWAFEIGDVEAIQYTSYGMGDFYAAHFDNGSKATEHRKLSLSVQLSPEGGYAGGALKFWSMNDKSAAPRAQGSMTAFPAYLMHVAKPVWWGRREVLVAWMHGAERLK